MSETMNIVKDIRRANAGRAGRIAVVDGGTVLCYGELLERVSELGRYFRAADIGAGMRVAFRCSDGAAYIIGSLALLEIGASVTPVDMSLPEEEVMRLLARIDVDGMLFETGSAVCLEGDKILDGPGAGFVWRERGARSAMPEQIRRLRPAFIRFSSGTTGASKGVALSHQTILERTEAADEALRITGDDRVLWVLSMSHHFVVSILLFLRKGAAVAVAHRNFPASICETALKGDITLIYAAPFHYHLLAGDKTVIPEALAAVRLALSTAMKLPADTAHAFADKFGFYPSEAYGIIEVGLPCIDLDPSAGSCGSVGCVLPAYEVRIDSPDCRGAGEVLVRGRGMFDAYMSPPRPREEALDCGWFRTGDIGYFGPDSKLRIAGRCKTVIICAGLKIFPEEVEEVLNMHEAVGESLVYGTEHPVYGQIPEACIVPARADAGGKQLGARLRRYCYERLPSYCVPKGFRLASELPRTASGKLLRR